MNWNLFWPILLMILLILAIPRRLLMVVGFVLVMGALLDPEITKTWLGVIYTNLVTWWYT